MCLWSSRLSRKLGHSPVSDPRSGGREREVESPGTSIQEFSIRTRTSKKLQQCFTAPGGALAPSLPSLHSRECHPFLCWGIRYVPPSFVCTPSCQLATLAHQTEVMPICGLRQCSDLDRANGYKRICNPAEAEDGDKNPWVIGGCCRKQIFNVCALSDFQLSQHPLSTQAVVVLPLTSPHHTSKRTLVPNSL